MNFLAKTKAKIQVPIVKARGQLAVQQAFAPTAQPIAPKRNLTPFLLAGAGVVGLVVLFLVLKKKK